MKGPELKIEFCAYYNNKKEKFDEGGLYPFLEYCQSSKPKDVVVRVDYDMDFDEIDIYCESLAIRNLSYEKIEQQAEEFNHSIKREFCFLFTHGLVHLLGLDHKTKEDEEKFNNIVYDVINAEKIYR